MTATTLIKYSIPKSTIETWLKNKFGAQTTTSGTERWKVEATAVAGEHKVTAERIITLDEINEMKVAKAGTAKSRRGDW